MHQQSKAIAEDNRAKNRQMRKLLISLGRPHFAALCFALGLNAFHGLAISFQTLLPKYLIDDVLLSKGLSNTTRALRLVELLAAYLVASVICRMAVWHIGYRIFTRIRESIILGLRSVFFRHINTLCLRFHERTSSGELFSYLFGSPLAQVQQYSQQFAMNGPGSVFTLVSSLIWVLCWDWVMTLILGGAIAANLLLMAHTRRRMQKIHAEFQAAEGHVSGHVSDLIRGLREIKLYTMEEQVMQEFQTQAGVISLKSIHRDVDSHIQFMKAETANYLFFSLLCAVGFWRFMHSGLKIGELQAYLSAFIALQGPLQQLMQISTLRGGAQASMERLNAVLSTESTTPEPINDEARIPDRSNIVLREVHFSYADSPTLQGINLCIPFGQRIAIVGPSGSGKSTLAQLLLRFYDPDSGEVLIGESNLRHCPSQSVRRHFGVVPQAPFFFQTTLRDNLRVTSPKADDIMIRAACEKSGAWEFVSSLPAGLDTQVGENGSTLSGGQRQRLAIARALLNKPDYFIFDEATSALDTVTERRIQESLSRALSDSTAIFIAHRLATVRSCDRILVMNKGQIVQDGTYRELISVPGLFAEMVESDQLKSGHPATIHG